MHKHISYVTKSMSEDVPCGSPASKLLLACAVIPSVDDIPCGGAGVTVVRLVKRQDGGHRVESVYPSALSFHRFTEDSPASSVSFSARLFFVVMMPSYGKEHMTRDQCQESVVADSPAHTHRQWMWSHLTDWILVKIFFNETLHQLGMRGDSFMTYVICAERGKRSHLQGGCEAVGLQVLVLHTPRTVNHHKEMAHLQERTWKLRGTSLRQTFTSTVNNNRNNVQQETRSCS